MKNILLLGVILISGCVEHHHQSLKEQLEEYDKNIIPVKTDQIQENRLDGFKYQKSQWTKTKKEFSVLERYNDFKLNQCQTCHKAGKIPNKVRNHKEIQLRHASSDVMNCKTCHDKKETWNLHMLNGQKVSINHPYQLCSQCHFEQVSDWANGAHGKRVGGWQGERVIKNCTDCHNPHSPQFHKQMPKVTPNFLQFKK